MSEKEPAYRYNSAKIDAQYKYLICGQGLPAPDKKITDKLCPNKTCENSMVELDEIKWNKQKIADFLKGKVQIGKVHDLSEWEEEDIKNFSGDFIGTQPAISSEKISDNQLAEIFKCPKCREEIWLSLDLNKKKDLDTARDILSTFKK